LKLEKHNIDRKKIGGKWKALILLILLNRPARFNKIKQLLPGIGSNTLSRCLNEMEMNGLVYDHASPGYKLTDNGRKISILIMEMKTIVDTLP
jgi:DNA-binding HxlR family transcriptional regulator